MICSKCNVGIIRELQLFSSIETICDHCELLSNINNDSSPILDINWDGFEISNLADPVANQDAANKKDIDTPYCFTVPTGSFFRIERYERCPTSGLECYHSELRWCDYGDTIEIFGEYTQIYRL